MVIMDNFNVGIFLHIVPKVLIFCRSLISHLKLLDMLLSLLFVNCSLLMFAQRRSNYELLSLVGVMFYLECCIGFMIMLLVPNSGLGYWISTVHPLSRLPVFLKGIFAGVLCIRINEGDETPVLGCGGAF